MTDQELKLYPSAVIGKWTLNSRTSTYGQHSYWHCTCKCGSVKIVAERSLLSGRSKSCGCYRKTVTGGLFRKHGLTGTSEHTAWSAMRQRCHDPKSNSYANYGGRGITVCDRWRSFDKFLVDMGPKPSSNHSLDRIDVNGNYDPANCRWATALEQSKNRRKQFRNSHVQKIIRLVLEYKKRCACGGKCALCKEVDCVTR